jgi:hypothetical protein
MNEKIKQLALQAGINFYKKPVLNKYYPELYDGEFCESELEQQQKFAELIVAESIKVMMENDYHGEWLGEKLKEHFGFEE